jgi:hypothetical protein
MEWMWNLWIWKGLGKSSRSEGILPYIVETLLCMQNFDDIGGHMATYSVRVQVRTMERMLAARTQLDQDSTYSSESVGLQKRTA